MRGWTFGRKLGAGLALIVALTITMGAVAFTALDAVVAAKDQVITDTAQDVIDAERVLARMRKEEGSARAYFMTHDRKWLDSVKATGDARDATLRRILTRGVDKHGAALLVTVEQASERYRGEVDKVVAQIGADADAATISAAFETRVVVAAEALEKAVHDFVTYEEGLLEVDRAAATASAATSSAMVLVIAVVAVLMALLIAVVLTRSLTGQIARSVQDVRSSSVELQATASQLASGAKEQSTAMSEIATTISQLLQSSRQIAESAQRVSRIATDAVEGARGGARSVQNAQDAVAGIKQQVDAIVQHMVGLGRKSQQIGGIVELINELAEQSNILAINATIEAAGAGEAGRRFGVVGEEMRRLADRVAGSTKEIRALIEDVRGAVNATVMATESGTKSVDVGVRRIDELKGTFMRIGDLVETTTEAAREIELSTKQQATAVEQVKVAVSNAAQATRETEAGSGQTLQTASQLAGLSAQLARLVRSKTAVQ